MWYPSNCLNSSYPTPHDPGTFILTCSVEFSKMHCFLRCIRIEWRQLSVPPRIRPEREKYLLRTFPKQDRTLPKDRLLQLPSVRPAGRPGATRSPPESGPQRLTFRPHRSFTPDALPERGEKCFRTHRRPSAASHRWTNHQAYCATRMVTGEMRPRRLDASRRLGGRCISAPIRTPSSSNGSAIRSGRWRCFANRRPPTF
jgi:hypothetical protein